MNTTRRTTPICTHCKNLGKTEREYTSHFPRKTPSQTSALTCPELLKKVCTRCPGRNHTTDNCSKEMKPIEQKTPVVANTNKYSVLLDDDDDDEEDVPREYGEELYAIVAAKVPTRACKIVGMLLELDESELIELLEKPAALKERLDEANQILDEMYNPIVEFSLVTIA